MIKTMLYYKLGFIEKNVIEYYDEMLIMAVRQSTFYILYYGYDEHVVGDFGYPV
jgi:hypothetical protein